MADSLPSVYGNYSGEYREVRQIEETNRKLRRDRIDSAKSQIVLLSQEIASLEALDKN